MSRTHFLSIGLMLSLGCGGKVIFDTSSSGLGGAATTTTAVTTTYVTAGVTSTTGANVTTSVTTGTGKDACQIYVADATAKTAACGVMSTTTSSSSGMAVCTPALAIKAKCLDKCLTEFDCCFLTAPTAPSCVSKEMVYSACAGGC